MLSGSSERGKVRDPSVYATPLRKRDIGVLDRLTTQGVQSEDRAIERKCFMRLFPIISNIFLDKWCDEQAYLGWKIAAKYKWHSLIFLLDSTPLKYARWGSIERVIIHWKSSEAYLNTKLLNFGYNLNCIEKSNQSLEMWL